MAYTKPELLALLDELLPDNDQGEITPADVREVAVALLEFAEGQTDPGSGLPSPEGKAGMALFSDGVNSLWQNTGVGTLASLLTAAKTSAVAAINEVRTTLSLSEEVTAAYTLALADAGQLVAVNSAGAVTVTVPANTTVAFPVGTVLQIRQRGAGQVTVAGASGVTLNAYGGLKTPGQYAEVGLHKVGANTWVLTGGTA